MRTLLTTRCVTRGFLLSSVLALVLATVACGGSDSSESDVAKTGTNEIPGAVALLKWSSQRMNEVTSFRANMTMEVDAQGQASAISMVMETSRDGRMRTTMDFSILGETQTVESIVDGSHFYAKVPIMGWVRMDATMLDAFGGPTRDALSLDFFSNLLPAGEVPWELYTVRDLGREQVDGIDTQHLSVQLDFQEVWEHLDDGRRDQLLLGMAPPPGTLDVSKLVDKTRIRDVEIWIDDQGYSRRQRLVFDLGEVASATIDMRMSAFDEDLSIRLPAQYQDLSEVSIPGLPIP